MSSNHKKDKAVVGGKVKLIVLFRNWAHQGFFYLDKTERLYRIIWEMIPMAATLFLLSFSNIPLWGGGNNIIPHCSYV